MQHETMDQKSAKSAHNIKALFATLMLCLVSQAASAVEVDVKRMDFYPPGQTTPAHVDTGVTGTIDFTAGTGALASGIPFFGVDWTATVAETWEAPGSYHYAGATALSPGSFDYPFTLEVGQYAAGLLFNWSGNNNIPVLAVFDCIGGTINLSPLNTDGDASPGTAMQTSPFPTQTPAFSGTLTSGVCPGIAVTEPSVVNDLGATLSPGTVDPSGDGTVTLSQVISAGIPLDENLVQQCVGGCFDFTIAGLTESAAVVVLPLSEPIPAAAVYRKWNGSSWQDFVTTDGNAIGSTEQIAPGECPDSGYSSGLNQGHTCIRLTIVDGGANDLDGEVNGEIVDPGGVGERVIPAASTSLGSGIGGGCTLTTRSGTGIPGDWLLIGGLLAGLGLYRRRLMS